MKKVVLLAFVLVSLCAMAVRKSAVKVEVLQASEDRPYEFHGSGLIGAAMGSRTRDVVFMLNAIVEGEHARLKCYENHKGCSPVGPGTYEGELKGDDLWISVTVPVTHKTVRDHWKVVGSW